MNDCKYLESVTRKLIPDIFDSINWNNIWKRKLEDGTGFQIMVLCSILSAAKQQGLSVDIPLLQQFTASDFFLLRNEIPLHHNAQAGNSATALHKKSLEDRFFFSLVPKFIVKKDDRFYSFFIEGCPYHKIATSKKYDLRPDIIVFVGKPEADSPRYSNNKKEIFFSFDTQVQIIGGCLRVINSPIIPCIQRSPNRNIDFTPVSVIECSVNKSKEIAEPQLDNYKQVFSDEKNQPILHIITGNKLVTNRCNAMSINLNDGSAFNDCVVVGQAILTSLFS